MNPEVYEIVHPWGKVRSLVVRSDRFTYIVSVCDDGRLSLYAKIRADEPVAATARYAAPNVALPDRTNAIMARDYENSKNWRK